MKNYSAYTFRKLIRKDMDVNECEKLSDITHRHKLY